jgi:ketosteroid isomerase-like protein
MATDPKTIVRRFDDELFNERNPAAAETILAEDVVWHHPTLGEIRGRQALLEVIQEMHTAYHDIVDTVKHMVAEGDMVATHGH